MVLWLAFGKLAHTYERGLQKLEQTVAKPKSVKKGRRWLHWLVCVPPLSWWSRDPVSRAAFLLTTAYLIRDRDVKLRVYPGIAPMLIFPFLFLFQKGAGMGNFGIAICGAYLGLIPLIAMSMLQYSQQWQASDIFRAAPMRGPAAIYHGARRTVLLFITLPILLILAILVGLLRGLGGEILLLLPGIIALPVYSMVPGIFGRAIPLSTPIEEAKSAKRGGKMLLALMISMLISAIASTAWSHGWFWPFLAAETLLVIAIYSAMRLVLVNMRWQSAE
jgi:ABC-2 type transport system permease protein